ncbi:Endonuclease MutS2 [Bienertia sinuspersici]
MFASSAFSNTITSFSIISSTYAKTNLSKSNSLKVFPMRFRFRASLNQQPFQYGETDKSISRVLLNSLRVLEWDKVCDAVSSFAGTSSGRIASKEQLLSLDQTYEESLMLLRETNAAVEIRKYNNAIMDFTAIDALKVRSAINHARRTSPVTGQEAMAIADLLQITEALQTNIKVAVKENADMLDHIGVGHQQIIDQVNTASH